MEQKFQSTRITEKESPVTGYISLILFFIIIVLGISFKTNRYKKLVNDFNNPLFLTALTLITGMTIYGLFFSKTLRFKKATAAGTSAFIIAYFARLDLVFLPFFLVLFQNYYFNLG